MKTTIKKTVSVILALATVTAASSFAFGADAAENGKVNVTVTNNTYSKESGAKWEGTLFTSTVEIEDSDNALNVLKKALAAEEIEYNIVDSMWGSYISEVDGISENDAAQYSGWMGMRNDWVVNDNLANITVKDGDTVNLTYSVTMGADIGADWMNSSTKLSDLKLDNALFATDFSESSESYKIVVDDPELDIKVIPTAANKYNQVRIYKNEYTPLADSYYRATDSIEVNAGDVIYVAIGNENWGGSTTGVDETVYTLEVANAVMGDANFSGKVDISDVTLVQMNIAQLVSFNSLTEGVADINRDDKVDISDVTMIQLKIANLL